MTRPNPIDQLSALAQETRLDVFRTLMASAPGEVAAGDIARRLGVQQNTLSTHLGILSRAGLIAARRDGRRILYCADVNGLNALLRTLVEDCCQGHPDVCLDLVPLGTSRAHAG